MGPTASPANWERSSTGSASGGIRRHPPQRQPDAGLLVSGVPVLVSVGKAAALPKRARLNASTPPAPPLPVSNELSSHALIMNAHNRELETEPDTQELPRRRLEPKFRLVTSQTMVLRADRFQPP